MNDPIHANNYRKAILASARSKPASVRVAVADNKAHLILPPIAHQDLVAKLMWLCQAEIDKLKTEHPDINENTY